MLKKLLSQSSYWVINKDLADKLGFEPTLLLTHLIECADMLDQPFYQQRDRILKTLGWSEKVYRRCVKKLKDNNLVSVEVKGMPPKNYWTINEREIHAIIETNSLDGGVKTTHPKESQNDATKKRNNKKRNNNTNQGEKSVDDNPSGVVPPFSPDENKKGGWEKLVDLFPTNKQKGIIEGAIIWNELSQNEKQQVMRHVVPYLNNTQPNYIKQIGSYMESRLWQQMKTPTKSEKGTYKNTGMIDYNLIKYFAELSEQTWDEAQKEFFTFDEQTKNQIINMYKKDLVK